MSSHKRGGNNRRPSGHASIDGDFSIGDLGELSSSVVQSSFNNRSSSTAFQFDYAKEREEIAKDDKYQIRYLKFVTMVILTLLALTVSLVVFFSVRKEEQDDFQENFWDGAQRIAATWERNMGLQIRAMDSLGIHVTSWASSRQSTWPLVTVPDFDLRGQSAVGFSGSMSTVLLPLVTNEDRLEYEAYTQLNVDTWVPADEVDNVSPFVSKREGDGLVAVTGDGPFFPAWTMFPIVPDIINLDFKSEPLIGSAVDEAYQSRQIVIGKIYGAKNETVSMMMTQDEETTDYGPVSSMLVPVFQDEENDELVALFSTSVVWSSLFQNSLSEDEEGQVFVVVMNNECGQVYSFQIQGPSVTSAVPGDDHDTAYDDFFYAYSFDNIVRASKSFVTPGSQLSINDDYCPYNLRIYPTLQLEEMYQTNYPMLYTLSVFIIFLLTAGVFGCYDFIMERRQQRVLTTAVEARAIVASLFPQQFRGRLFEQQRQQISTGMKSLFQLKGRKSGGRRSPSASVGANTEEGSPESSHEEEGQLPVRTLTKSPGLVSQSTLRLKTFLNESSTVVNDGQDEPQTRPIADLFPQTTVLFGDIVGFTSWCSQRDPENVFTLLETIFRTYDKIARKRGVFKVETIGDCYMCVTGLPDPQPDHAWVMAKFALDARTKMAEVLQDLERVLGPDTSELSMRFGMHSGPTTAGVLRGDKSRFQLFGDTVNFASRMESTGMPNRIQCSQATADRLKELGKGGWLRPRSEMIQAKGKGMVQTYWLASRSNEEDKKAPGDLLSPSRRNLLASTMSSEDQVSTRMGLGADFSDSDDDEEEGKGGQSMMINGHMSTLFEEEPPERKSYMKKQSKVIMWQSEIIIRALKLIVARRGQKCNVPMDVSKLTLDLPEDGIILDEVVEAVELPDFDAKAIAAAVDPEDVVLSPALLTQVHDYVSMLASMYTDNLAFHNFEHASHVAMSAMKLLNRIVVLDVDNVTKATDLHISTDGINSDPLTQFALVFAALIHDVDHPGVPNETLAQEDPDLALLYRNKSMAEQKSFDIAWNLLMDPKYLDLRSCIYASKAELQRFRQLVVNCVIATDMFDPEMRSMRERRWEKEFGDITHDSEDIVLGNRQATIIIEHIMQVSDVAHTMQHWEVYVKWNERLLHERMRAYKKGREKQNPSLHWYEQELDFFDNYVIPLAKRLQGLEVFGIAQNEYLNYALENRQEWEAVGRDYIKVMVRNFDNNKELQQSYHRGRARVLEEEEDDEDDDVDSIMNGSASITFDDLKF